MTLLLTDEGGHMWRYTDMVCVICCYDVFVALSVSSLIKGQASKLLIDDDVQEAAKFGVSLNKQ